MLLSSLPSFGCLVLGIAMALGCSSRVSRNGAGAAQENGKERTPPASSEQNFSSRYRCPDEFQFAAAIEAGQATLFLPDRTITIPRAGASGAQFNGSGITFSIRGQESELELDGKVRSKCSAQPQPVPWERARLSSADFWAVGQEPFWSMEIDNEKSVTVLTNLGQDRVVTPVPTPIAEAPGKTRYRIRTEAHALDILLESKACHDSMSGEPFPQTVSIELDGKRYQGCGRALR